MRQPLPPPKRLPTPQPTALRHHPSADDFALWALNPVTQWVAKAYAQGAEANIDAWEDMLGKDVSDAELVKAKVEYRTRSDAYLSFLQTNHADYLKTLDPEAWEKIYRG